jgi:hypothetical protein
MLNSAKNDSCGSYHFLSTTILSFSKHMFSDLATKVGSLITQLHLHSHKVPDSLCQDILITMIFHPSACSILLLLLHGGHPHRTRGQPADSTRYLKHEKVDSPAPSSYPPTTDRPSLPIPSYSPTQSFKVADLIAPSPDCAPIGSRSSPSSDEKPMPTDAPNEVTFLRGDLRKDIKRLGIKVSKGITVRVIANAGRFVNFANGAKSSLPFHSSPDGAAVFPLTNGGYVYVSNSEVEGKRGGVYGVYFNDAGKVVNYKMLLSGTSRNCSGGSTPWRSFVSCEEYGSGQCYQVDPDPKSVHHLHPEKTVLGGKGGNYEAVVRFHFLLSRVADDTLFSHSSLHLLHTRRATIGILPGPSFSSLKTLSLVPYDVSHQKLVISPAGILSTHPEELPIISYSWQTVTSRGLAMKTQLGNLKACTTPTLKGLCSGKIVCTLSPRGLSKCTSLIWIR